MKKTILFLGYNKKQTKLIRFLRSKKIIVKTLGQKKLSKKDVTKNIILIVSFGYKHIIKKDILKFTKKIDFINLHMSYLPHNRGAHPNFWSFYKNSPKGVSIHLMDKKIDKGNLILRKRVFFKNINKQTFKSTYNILFKKIESLFIKSFSKIISKRYKIIKISEKGSFHKRRDLPSTMVDWDVNIKKYLKNN